MKVGQHLNGADSCSKSWDINGRDDHQCLRCQHGGGGIVICTGIIGGIIIGLWRVRDGMKITTDAYIAFLKECLESWLQKAKNHFQENYHIYAIFLHIQHIKLWQTCRN